MTRALSRRSEKQPPFRPLDGEAVPGTIAEMECRRLLGPLDQWMMVRGESADR